MAGPLVLVIENATLLDGVFLAKDRIGVGFFFFNMIGTVTCVPELSDAISRDGNDVISLPRFGS